MKKKPVVKSSRFSNAGSTLETAKGSNSQVPEDTIRQLSEILRSTDLAEIEISVGGTVIRVRAKEQMVASIAAPVATALPSVASPSVSAKAVKAPEAASDLHILRSPFIGTFYRSPSPTSPMFVELNQSISKGQTLCIVEAMKLMNEIESDVSGVLEKIFVENGTPVDFNTPLFGIRR